MVFNQPMVISTLIVIAAGIVGALLFWIVLPILDKKYDILKALKTAQTVADGIDQAATVASHVLPYGVFISDAAHLAKEAVAAAQQIYTEYEKDRKKGYATDFVTTAFNMARPNNPLTDQEKTLINGSIESAVFALKKAGGQAIPLLPTNIQNDVKEQLDVVKEVPTNNLDTLLSVAERDVEGTASASSLAQVESMVLGQGDNTPGVPEVATPPLNASDGMVLGQVKIKPVDQVPEITNDPGTANAVAQLEEMLVEDPTRPGVWVKPSELNQG